ncbi:MAG: hypothetical protein ABI339_01660 [Solirubrobacteraceae bacterium]
MPPRAAPPPFVVLEVLEPVRFVAALLVDLLVEVELGVDVVLLGVLVAELVELRDVDVLLELEQSRAASWLTVAAPWPRLLISFLLTLVGRFATSLLKA